MITTLFHLGAAVAGWRKRRAAILELSRLSDVTLRDIGVRRVDIPRIVDKALAAKRAARIPRVIADTRRPAFESHEVC